MSRCFNFDKYTFRNTMYSDKANKHRYKKGYKKKNHDTRNFGIRNGYPDESNSHQVGQDKRVLYIGQEGVE